jgi:hypothetical protein
VTCYAARKSPQGIQSNQVISAGTTEQRILVVVRYSATYIDKIFAEEDLMPVYETIEVVSRGRSLPEEFWLFCRIYEWAPSRSGVWQYYENLPDQKFERVSAALARCGLHDVAQRYRSGKDAWQDEEKMQALDTWLDVNAAGLHALLLGLIRPQMHLLK